MKAIFTLFVLMQLSVNYAKGTSDSDSLINKDDTSSVLNNIFIDKIIIAGNDKTDEEIILREMSVKGNSKLDVKLLEKDIEKLYKLGLFNKVDFIPIRSETPDKINLMILVEERFYLLPIPQGGFRNGEFSKFWAGLNLVWNNFRGRNETAALNFGIGYEPFVKLSYSVPWIGERAHFFSTLSADYSKTYNRSLEALNDTTSTALPSSDNNFVNYNLKASYSLGKYLSENLSVRSELAYRIIDQSKYVPGRTVSNDGKDNFMTFGVNGKYDSRNSSEYTLSGVLLSLEYIKYGFGKLFDFNRINLNAKIFYPLTVKGNYKITLASHLNSAISFGGTIPSYLNEFYGYDKIIRGYKKIVFEGENSAGIFNEIRIPLIEPYFIKGSSLPVVKKIGTLKRLNYKFGLYATLFFDVGGVWNKTDNFFKTGFRNGFGSGLNFILPFGFTGRTDLAFRKENKRFIPQVIFDLEASF